MPLKKQGTDAYKICIRILMIKMHLFSTIKFLLFHVQKFVSFFYNSPTTLLNIPLKSNGRKDAQ